MPAESYIERTLNNLRFDKRDSQSEPTGNRIIKHELDKATRSSFKQPSTCAERRTNTTVNKKHTGAEMEPTVAYQEDPLPPIKGLTIIDAVSNSLKMIVGENAGNGGVNAVGDIKGKP